MKKFTRTPKEKKPANPVREKPKGAKRQGEQFVLLIGDEGGILVFLQGNKVARRLYAPNVEPDQVKSFVELMEAHPWAPITLLVDMMDQTYVRHTLPPVSPLSVNKLVQRRLDRDFAPEDIKGFLPMGREKQGRRDWNFLLISVANSAVLQQWMDLVIEKPNFFKGLYLVPVEAQAYIQELAGLIEHSKEQAKPQWQILISHHKVGGFRQVVLNNGKLVFTRLAQAVGESTPAVIAGNVEQEVLNTIEYLRRLSYNEAAGLEVIIIIAQEVKDVIDVGKFNARSAVLLSPFEVSQQLGLEQAALSGDRFGDVVLCAAFARHRKRRLKLNSVYGHKLERMHQMHLASRAAAVLVGLGLIFSIGSAAYHAFSAVLKADDLQSRQQALISELAETEAQIKSLGADINLKTNVVTVYETLKPEEFDVLDFIKELALFMGGERLVKKLDWSLENDPAAPAGTPEATMPQIMRVEMQVEILNRDKTQAGFDRMTFVAEATDFIESMQSAFPNFEVTHEQLPGTVSMSENLQVNFNDQATKELIPEGQNIVTLTIVGPKSQAATAIPTGLLGGMR